VTSATARRRPELADEVGAVLPDAAVAVERHLPQALAAQRRDPEGPGRHGRPARRRLLRPPRDGGVDEARVAAAPLDDRPAVVAAGPDEVDLVEGVLPQLAGPEPAGAVEAQALHVAVTEAEHRERGSGLSPGTAPSRVTRRIFPPEERGSCDRLVFAASPVPM
jgi:hypothetical protein